MRDSEYRQIERAARARRLSIAEWVRQALAHACPREAVGDVEKKLAAIRAAAALNLGPEVDIDTMLAEIEQGYTSGQP